MDPSQEPDLPIGGGASVAQLPSLVVDRDHQPVDVSSPFIDDWTMINSNNVPWDDSISCSDISTLDLNDALEAQPTAPTAQDASDLDVSSDQIDATATPSTPEIDLTNVSSNDFIAHPDITELGLNNDSEAHPPAPTAHDASDLDISSDQTQAKATSSVSGIPNLNSEWESLSAEIWATVHPSSSDIPDPEDASEAQPTTNTAHPASDRDDSSDRIQETTPSSLISDISELSELGDVLKAQSTDETASVASDFAYLVDHVLATATLVVASRQRSARATTSASNISPLSRWEAANNSATNIQGWATANSPASHIQDWTTATSSASNMSSHQRWATATTSAPTQPAAPAPTNPVFPFVRSSAPTQGIWPAPDPSEREWAAAYVPSTTVNVDPILPFNPIWDTPNSIRRFKPLPVPLPTYENGGLPLTEPLSENLVLDVADDTFDPVKAVDPAMASDHVSLVTRYSQTYYKWVEAVRECLRYFSTPEMPPQGTP